MCCSHTFNCFVQNPYIFGFLLCLLLHNLITVIFWLKIVIFIKLSSNAFQICLEQHFIFRTWNMTGYLHICLNCYHYSALLHEELKRKSTETATQWEEQNKVSQDWYFWKLTQYFYLPTATAPPATLKHDQDKITFFILNNT